jgi:hypothetical protein
MSCSKCKEKKNFNQEFEKKTEFINKGVVWFFIIWSLLALYGIYNLITLI